MQTVEAKIKATILPTQLTSVKTFPPKELIDGCIASSGIKTATGRHGSKVTRYSKNRLCRIAALILPLTLFVLPVDNPHHFLMLFVYALYLAIEVWIIRILITDGKRRHGRGLMI